MIEDDGLHHLVRAPVRAVLRVGERVDRVAVPVHLRRRGHGGIVALFAVVHAVEHAHGVDKTAAVRSHIHEMVAFAVSAILVT